MSVLPKRQAIPNRDDAEATSGERGQRAPRRLPKMHTACQSRARVARHAVGQAEKPLPAEEKALSFVTFFSQARPVADTKKSGWGDLPQPDWSLAPRRWSDSLQQGERWQG